MSNVYSGVVGGVEGGAVGVVVAHWSSTAALTPLVFAWPPILIAAGLSWNHNTHWVGSNRIVRTILKYSHHISSPCPFSPT